MSSWCCRRGVQQRVALGRERMGRPAESERPEPSERGQETAERPGPDHPAGGLLAHEADATFECGIAPADEQFLPPRMVPPRGAGQRERPCSFGVLDRHDLADRAAHRRSDDVGGLDAGVVEHGDRVVGHLLQRVRAVRLVAAPRPPVVERDRLVPGCGGESLQVPAVLVGAETLDEEDRRLAADGRSPGSGCESRRCCGRTSCWSLALRRPLLVTGLVTGHHRSRSRGTSRAECRCGSHPSPRAAARCDCADGRTSSSSASGPRRRRVGRVACPISTRALRPSGVLVVAAG